MRYAVLLLSFATAASAQDLSGFEKVAATSTPFDQALAVFQALAATCDCANEFEAKDCEAAKKAAALRVRGGLVVSLPVKGGEVELGTYDFSKKGFPASLKGGAMLSEPVKRCVSVSQQKCGDVAPLAEGLEPVLTLRADGAKAWQGTLAVEESAARALREDPSLITGEVLFRVMDDDTSTPASAAAKKEKQKRLVELLKEKKKLKGASAEAVADFERRKSCVSALPVTGRKTEIELRLVGLRLEAKNSPEYLISHPPSQLKLSTIRQAEIDAKLKAEADARAKVEAEAAAKAQAEKEAKEKAEWAEAERKKKESEAEQKKREAEVHSQRLLADLEVECGVNGSTVRCLQLGRIYEIGRFENGDEAPKDLRRAIIAYRNACKRGEELGCQRADDLAAQR